MSHFILKAENDFDFVIIDTPPVAIVTDTVSLKNMVDAFVFVIRHNYFDKQVLDLVNNIY